MGLGPGPGFVLLRVSLLFARCFWLIFKGLDLEAVYQLEEPRLTLLSPGAWLVAEARSFLLGSLSKGQTGKKRGAAALQPLPLSEPYHEAVSHQQDRCSDLFQVPFLAV